VIYRNILFL